MAQRGGGLSRGTFDGSSRPPKRFSRPPYLDVYSWEKQFFNYECPITWGKLSHDNQFMLSYKKVQEWDDSAGLEALLDAKFCEWAKINNHQSDIPLPNPDMYIDDVAYDAFIDPELLADLHNCEPEQAAPVDSSVSYMNESVRDIEHADTQVPVPTSGLTARHLSTKSDVLVIGNTVKPTGCNVAENSYGWDVKGKSSNARNSASWGKNGGYDSRWRTSDGRGAACVKNSWQGNERDNTWNAGMHKTSGRHGNTNYEAGGRYGRGCFDSRKTTSGFKTDHHPSNSGWKIFRGKQSRFDPNEKTIYAGKRTSLQWRPKSSVPGNNQAPNDSGTALQCEKPVSQ